MAFSDFRFPQVLKDLGLAFREADLFPAVPPAAVRPEFRQRLDEGVRLATAVNTEKARSEFVIAPVLLELKHLLGHEVALFSGTPLDGDAARQLTGVCDFVLAKSPVQMILTAPLVAIVEAKNVDLMGGMGQCIAATYAAKLFNDREGRAGPVYGVCTTGTEWRFLRLDRDEVTTDPRDVAIRDVGLILGVLTHVVRAA